MSKSKVYRILDMYERLNRGEVKNKQFFVEKYEVDKKQYKEILMN